MKKLIAFFIIISFVLIGFTSCSQKPPYSEKFIEESYMCGDISAAVFNTSYPVFEGEDFDFFNQVIADEIENQRKIYNEICDIAEEDYQIDPACARLQRYVKSEYFVEYSETEYSVSFDVEFYREGNAENSYQKKFTLSLESFFVYETYTVTKRVY